MTTTPVTGDKWGDEVERSRTYMLQEGSKPLSELLAGVEASRQALLDSLAGVSETQARFRPGKGGPDDEDSFSVAEVARHMVNVEPVMRQRVINLALGDEPPAGQGPGALGGNDNVPLRELAGMIEENRSVLHDAIASIDGTERLDTMTAHRVFGDFNCHAWLCLHGLHIADHARQVGKIKANPNYPKA